LGLNEVLFTDKFRFFPALVRIVLEISLNFKIPKNKTSSFVIKKLNTLFVKIPKKLKTRIKYVSKIIMSIKILNLVSKQGQKSELL
jgi:hypothetical protein